jgi:hypothetical protein
MLRMRRSQLFRQESQDTRSYMKALLLPLMMVAMSASAQMSGDLASPEIATGALLLAGTIALIVARKLAK